ncbi:MAG TPA: hypothetical protein VIJ28_11260 [Chloroflexota bacterium]
MKYRGSGQGSPDSSPRGLRRFLPAHPRRALDQVQGEYLAWILKEVLAGGWRSLLGRA